MKYEHSLYNSGKRSESNALTITSIQSSGQSEEEIIIRGEINKNAINKEEDFVNNSFKKEVKNQGGMIIKPDESINTISDSQKESSLFDSGLENISEIHSNKTVPSQSTSIKTNSFKSNNSHMYMSTIKGYNDNLIRKKNKNNLDGLIIGRYNINGQSKQDYNIMQYKWRYNEKNNINNNINGTKSSSRTSSVISKLNQSNKINISIHESCPRYDSFLNVPNTDSPLSDIDELSDKII